MGLLTSVNNINYTIEEQRKQKQLEKIQKQKEKIKQEELKAYKNDLENFAKNEFNNYFNIAGSVYIYEFYNKDRKAEILNNFFDTIKTIDSKGFEKIPYKKELEQHFYNKYNIILNKCKKEQEQQEIYNIMTETKKTQIEAEEEVFDDFNPMLYEKLIEATGGIVQGMSGSPIIQDGKLIGAVTHVFVNDPTKGYGIFAENMLEMSKKCG